MFKDLKQLPEDSIFKVVREFNEDKRPDKINLSIGVYTDEDGAPFVFPSVKRATEKIEVNNFNYLPIQGNSSFLSYTKELYFGDTDSQLASQQTCGGTHACALFSDLLEKNQGKTDVYLGTPCWDNYHEIFRAHKLVEIPHLDSLGAVDVGAYEIALSQAKEGSVLLLQGGSTHNPTGKNLSVADLKKLLPLVKEKHLYVFVDFAYLGFGAGFAEDRKFIELLDDNLDEFTLAVSYSKNASLYKHRTGALFVKVLKESAKRDVESNLQNLVRKSVSNLPAYGSELLVTIFENYFDEWKQEVDEARRSIDERRILLVKALPNEFSHLSDCSGMFGISGITKDQVALLKEKYAIYMPDNGRLNFAGIKTDDIEKIASSIESVTNQK